MTAIKFFIFLTIQSEWVMWGYSRNMRSPALFTVSELLFECSICRAFVIFGFVVHLYLSLYRGPGSRSLHLLFHHPIAVLPFLLMSFVVQTGTSRSIWVIFRYELSRHRSRPPCPGIHRRTRLLVVDNSEMGKEANMSGKLPYCIHVYKQGYRKKHMPHATLGDKVRLFICLWTVA